MGNSGHNSAALIKSYIDRINDRLDAKQVIADEVKDIYAQAKESGLNVKGLREHIRQMREDEEKRRAKQEAVEEIRNQLGAFANSPLGQSALENALRS